MSLTWEFDKNGSVAYEKEQMILKKYVKYKSNNDC